MQTSKQLKWTLNGTLRSKVRPTFRLGYNFKYFNLIEQKLLHFPRAIQITKHIIRSRWISRVLHFPLNVRRVESTRASDAHKNRRIDQMKKLVDIFSDCHSLSPSVYRSPCRHPHRRIPANKSEISKLSAYRKHPQVWDDRTVCGISGGVGPRRGTSISAQKHTGGIEREGWERKIARETKETPAFRSANISRERKQPPIPSCDSGEKASTYWR